MMKLVQITVITTVLGGCMGMSDSGQPTTGPNTYSESDYGTQQQVAASTFSLEGASWGLLAAGPRGAERSVAPGINITFSRDGKVSGQGGCNRFFGDYSIDPNGGLRVGQINRTRKLCPPNIMQPENDFLADLREVSSYAMDADRLHLFHASGALIFSPN